MLFMRDDDGPAASCRRPPGRCASTACPGCRQAGGGRRAAVVPGADAVDHRHAGVSAHAGSVREHRAAALADGNAQLRIVSPLLQLDRLVGFVVLYDPPPPFELTYEDRDLLKTVGRHVATHLAQQRPTAGWPRARSSRPTTASPRSDARSEELRGAAAADRRQRGRHKHNPDSSTTRSTPSPTPSSA